MADISPDAQIKSAPVRATARSTAFGIASLGIAIYSTMDTLMKQLSIEIGAYSAVLWRSIIGSVLLGAIFVARRQRWPGRAALKLHVARATVAGASVTLFFWGLARVPLAEGTALTFIAPLIALYLAAATLGEKIGRGAIIGSVLASLGVLVLAAGQVQAHASTDHVMGSIAIFAASVLYAGSLILLRQQAQLADPLEVALFTSLVLGAELLLVSPWFAVWPSAAQVPQIAMAAVLGSVSAMLIAWAYARAEAQVLAPVEYTAFVWAAILGWLIFDERVSFFTIGGTTLIIGGCLVAVRSPIAPGPQTEAAA